MSEATKHRRANFKARVFRLVRASRELLAVWDAYDEEIPDHDWEERVIAEFRAALAVMEKKS